MTPLGIVRGTIILATVAWAVGETLMRRSRPADRWARAIWTAGLASALLHVILAYGLVYAWNHEAAVSVTAQQTAERFGWTWRGGIYVNYGFLAVWCADVCWWWAAPASHLSRSLRFEAARLLLFIFMFTNAAIVFASPSGRFVGIAAVGAVVLFARPLRRPALSV